MQNVLCDTAAHSGEQALKCLLSPWSMDCQEGYLEKFFIPFLSCQYELLLTVAAEGILAKKKRGVGGAPPNSLFILNLDYKLSIFKQSYGWPVGPEHCRGSLLPAIVVFDGVIVAAQLLRITVLIFKTKLQSANNYTVKLKCHSLVLFVLLLIFYNFGEVQDRPSAKEVFDNIYFATKLLLLCCITLWF